MTPQQMEPLPLDQPQFGDFAALRDLGADCVRKLVDVLRELPIAPMRPSRLADVMAGGLPEGREATATGIAQQAILLHGWVRQGGFSLESVLGSLTAALEESSGWSTAERERWHDVEPVFRDLMQLPVVRLSAAANDLAFEHTHLLQRVRILTEIRPIFDEDATAIEGAVISHALRLVYQSIDGPHELTLALDEMDIDAISDQCDRARQKSRTARDLMNGQANVPSVISGETGDE